MTQSLSEARMLSSIDDWLLSNQTPCLETTKSVPQLVQIYKKVFSDIESKLALSAQKATLRTEVGETKKNNTLSKVRPKF